MISKVGSEASYLRVTYAGNACFHGEYLFKETPRLLIAPTCSYRIICWFFETSAALYCTEFPNH